MARYNQAAVEFGYESEAREIARFDTPLKALNSMEPSTR